LIIEEVRDTDEKSDVRLKKENRYGSVGIGNSEKPIWIYTQNDGLFQPSFKIQETGDMRISQHQPYCRYPYLAIKNPGEVPGPFMIFRGLLL
jgi:hypothetical protein